MPRPLRPLDDSASWMVLPVPRLDFAATAALVQLFLIGGIGQLAELDPFSLVNTVGSVVASVAIYAALLCLLAKGDPRSWRDPVRFAALLAPDRDPDPAADELARAQAWHAATGAMARQSGFLAGVWAGSSFAQAPWWQGYAVWAAVGLAVWAAVLVLVRLPDQAKLAPVLARAGS